MNRERALKVVLVLVGLLFSAAIYPVTMSLWKMNESDYGDDMMLSLYFALGIFLLMAVRNPSANRSLIAFAAWSSFAHGAVMAVLAVHLANERRDLLSAVAVLVIIGAALIALAPARQSGERTSAAGA
jgi:peptidoglycan/LPS O-acetylase OafA/YrhL